MSKTILVLVDSHGRPIMVDGQTVYYSAPGDDDAVPMKFTTNINEAWNLAPICHRFRATEYFRLAPLTFSK